MLTALKDLLAQPVAKKLLAVGLLLHILLFCVVQINKPDIRPTPPPSYIGLLQQQPFNSSTAIEDQAILFDTEPIILPTLWNFSRPPLKAQKQHEAVTPFQAFEPIISLNASTLLPNHLESTTHPSSTLALKTDYWGFCSHFTQESKSIKPLPQRHAFLRIQDLETGNIVKEKVLASPDLQEPIIEKLEYLALIGNLESHGPILQLNTTGSDEIDLEAKNLINANINTWDLHPGYYKILIGP